MYQSTISVLALAIGATAVSHSIDVGKNGALMFSPNSLTAAVGDTLEFHFHSGSGGHSVVSSTFASPCMPASGGFFSGYIPGDDAGDMTFVVEVTSTDPIWFYCSLASHCAEGMVGVVNPPSGETVTDFANAAKKVTQASAPASPQGGTLTSINDSGQTSVASTQTSTAVALTSSTAGTGSGAGLTTTVPSSTASTSATGGSVSSASSSPASTQANAATSSQASTSSVPKASNEAGTKGITSVVLSLSIILAGVVALMA